MTILNHPIVKGILNYIQENENIDGLVIYGSHVTHTANDYSDIDFYYIPNKEDYSPCHQFIIENIGYDLWPIDWDRLEAISKLKDSMSSLIMDSLLIYTKNDSVEIRFNGLKDQLIENLNNEAVLIDIRHNLITEIKGLAFEYFTKNHLLDEVLSKIHLYLSYKNNTYIKKSTANIMQEIKEYTYLPKSFKNNFLEVIKGNKESLIKLIGSLEEKDEVYNKAFLSGFYEELKSTYNKALHGIETEDAIKLFFSIQSIERETKWVLKEKYQELEFPELTELFIEEQLTKDDIEHHEQILVNFLKDESIGINSFRTLSEYLTWLEAR